MLPRSGGTEGPTPRFRGERVFHVSPFMGMDPIDPWKVTEPGEALHVSIANEETRRGRFFAASLDLERREITGARLARSLVADPFMTGRILAGLYAQAFRLRRQGAPTFPHPGGIASALLEAPR